MRSKGLAIVLVLAAAAGVAWWLTRPSGDSTVDAGAGDAGSERGGTAPGAVGAPDLASGAGRGEAGARGGTSVLARERRGRSSIVGTVRRHGAPTAAKIEVRWSMDADPMLLFRRGAAGLFARLLSPPLSLERPAAVATAGADGRFVVEGIGTGGWQVLAIGDAGGRGTADVAVAVEGARAGADVELIGGEEVLAGRVVRADGKPWKGYVAVDRQTAASTRNSPLGFVAGDGSVVVDEQGRFEARGLERGTYVVSAIDPGVLRVIGKPVAVPAEGAYVLTIPAPTILLEGRVLADPDGGAIGGAEIFAGGRGGGEMQLAIVRTVSDPDGKFSLPLATGPERGLIAMADGFATTMVPLEGGRPGTPLEIRLSRAGRITGRVTAEGTGAPVAGLTVTASPSGRGMPFAAASATTDADGRYAVEGVPPGEASVAAAGDGWVTKGVGEASGGFNPLMVAIPMGGAATLDLVVVRGARLTGVVLGTDGAPVVGAIVVAESTTEGPGFRMGPGPSGASVATGADGLFGFDALIDGAAYRLVVTAVGAAETRAGPVTATTGNPPPRVEVRLEAPRIVVVTVLEAESHKPVVGAAVTAMLEQSRGSFGGSGGASTDVDGVARLTVPPGTGIQVSVWADDYLRREPQALAPGVDRLTLELRRGLEIAGTLLDLEGKPVADARIGVTSEGRWVRPVQTDAQGKFRFVALEAGSYRLEARVAVGSPSGLVATATVDAGARDVVLRLARGAGDAKSLLVHVVDGDGRPVPRATILLKFANGSDSRGVENGSAILDASDRAEGFAGASVAVSNATTINGSPLPWGPATFGPLTGKETEIEIRLPAEKAITGVVLDAARKPVRGVRVVAVSPERGYEVEWALRGEGGSLPVARTDAEGRFRLGGLGDDEVSLAVAPPPESAAPESVRARGGDANVEIVLPAGTAAVVTVLDTTGAAVAGAVVTTSIPVVEPKEGGRWVPPRSGPTATTDASGAARLRGLDRARRYLLRVQGPGADWMAWQREEWSPRDETIRIERAYRVTGIVRTPAGAPLAGVTVYRKDGEHGWAGGGATDADGRFSLEGVPAGDVVLHASVDDFGVGAETGPGTTEQRVRAGAKDVELVLDPGGQVTLHAPEGARDRWQRVDVRIARGEDWLTRSVRFDRERIAVVRGLQPQDRVAVFLAPDAQGRSALAEGLTPGADVVLTPAPGRSITGRLSGPPGSTNLVVQATHATLGFSIGAHAANGTFQIDGVPDGTTWTLSATCQVGERWIQTVGPTVAAGGTANLDLVDTKDK